MLDKLIKDWERFVERYYKLGIEAVDSPIKQEGLFCRSKTYHHCISQLQEELKEEKNNKITIK